MARNNKNNIPLDSLREEQFCRYYAQTLKKKESAIRAGYAESSAADTATRLLKRPSVIARLGQLIDLTPEKITNTIACIAEAELTDIVEFDSDQVLVRSSDEIPPRARAALKSIKIRKTPILARGEHVSDKVEIEVTMHDKLSALKELGRIFRIYPEQISVLDAMQLLLQEGIASEEEAEVLGNGLAQIKETLVKLRTSKNNGV